MSVCMASVVFRSSFPNFRCISRFKSQLGRLGAIFKRSCKTDVSAVIRYGWTFERTNSCCRLSSSSAMICAATPSTFRSTVSSSPSARSRLRKVRVSGSKLRCFKRIGSGSLRIDISPTRRYYTGYIPHPFSPTSVSSCPAFLFLRASNRSLREFAVSASDISSETVGVGVSKRTHPTFWNARPNVSFQYLSFLCLSKASFAVYQSHPSSRCCSCLQHDFMAKQTGYHASEHSDGGFPLRRDSVRDHARSVL
jgi:hypothetical protein